VVTAQPLAVGPAFVVLVGVLLIVAAVLWRASLLAWNARRLRAALTDDDPLQRLAGVEVATTQGLTRHAAALIALARGETDTTVLDALSAAVKRHVWEPGDSRNVVELRLWADRWGRNVPATTTQSATAVPAPESLRVVVTGAGGPAGVSVVRALSAAGHYVIAVDADPLAAGLHLANESATVPQASDARFCDLLMNVAGDSRADALISTVTEEMLVLSTRVEEVRAVVPTWLPPHNALEICNDKWLFAGAMREAGVRVPATALGSPDGVPGPWVVKPRFARGSRGVRLVDRPADFDAAFAGAPDPIVQTRIMGHEFTVDALMSPDEELIGAVPRWRLETKAGVSTKGRTFSDDRVLCGTAAVLSAVHLQGAANVQGFVDGDDVWFIEVNPRFSGGLPLALAAGADLVGEYLRGVLGLPMRCSRLAYRDGTTMIRHFEEIYA
jgi:carbamoyl-phosphate synthase large subunit